VAGGGTTDWTQRLLSDRHEGLLVSGFGTEMLARFLRPPNGDGAPICDER
jgi:hypothetical protein